MGAGPNKQILRFKDWECTYTKIPLAYKLLSANQAHSQQLRVVVVYVYGVLKWSSYAGFLDMDHFTVPVISKVFAWSLLSRAWAVMCYDCFYFFVSCRCFVDPFHLVVGRVNKLWSFYEHNGAIRQQFSFAMCLLWQQSFFPHSLCVLCTK